jgi:hypothetical protein
MMSMGKIDLKRYARINQFLAKNSRFILDALREDIRDELHSCWEGYYVLVEIFRDGKVYIEQRKENDGGYDVDESVFHWEWHWKMNSEKDDIDYDLIFDLEFCGELYDWMAENEIE